MLDGNGKGKLKKRFDRYAQGYIESLSQYSVVISFDTAEFHLRFEEDQRNQRRYRL